jgi:hypothetical protein
LFTVISLLHDRGQGETMADGGSGCNDFLGQYRAISSKLKKYVKKTSIIMKFNVVMKV